MYKISVVIPTYNRSALLENTLIALTHQSLPKDLFEVIVVDDGGSDDSSLICKKYYGELNIRYYWQYDDGFRAGKARNIGVAAAEGDYILFIDTGVLLHEDALTRHLEAHTNNAHPTVCIGYVYAFEVSEDTHSFINNVIRPDEVSFSIEKLKKLDLLDIRQRQYDSFGYDIYGWPAPFDILWTCHVSVEKQEIINAGLFDESFNSWGGEDVDLGVRLYQRNNRFIVNKNLCSIHSPHPKQISNHNSATISAGIKIHQKYNLWQTSFYKFASEDEKFSLNERIFLSLKDN